MCFSAEASFGASIILTTVGVVALKKADQTQLKYIALIPIFFGIQQFAEGVVWLANTYEQFAGFKSFSTYTFIFFAWIIWPIFIPFSLMKIESNPKKKKVQLVLTIIGWLLAAALTYIMVFEGVHSKIQDCSIFYDYDSPQSLGWLFALLYLGTVVIPTFISSLPNIWWLGAANILLYFITKIYYNERVISVWCFLAAFTSIFILWIIIKEQNRENANNE